MPKKKSYSTNTSETELEKLTKKKRKIRKDGYNWEIVGKYYLQHGDIQETADYFGMDYSNCYHGLNNRGYIRQLKEFEEKTEKQLYIQAKKDQTRMMQATSKLIYENHYLLHKHLNDVLVVTNFIRTVK